jgi:transposase
MNFIKRKEPIMENTNNNIYRHYIALDWSKQIVAMATMRDSGGKIEVQMLQAEPRIIRDKLKKYPGSKILTIEETTTSHWLYVELKESVDRIIICDPYRNSLLKDGPQTDKIDAKKLCILLRTGMLKEVYHTLEKDYEIRKLVSGYIDTVKASVRLKNQRSAIFRSVGRNHKKEKELYDGSIKEFVTQKQNELLSNYAETIEEYETEFKKIAKANKTIQRLKKISGIGTKTAIMIYSTVIDANRFENKYKYWSYCGLIKQYKESGGKTYRSKLVRYSKLLKKCYKSSTLAAINGKNDIREYYEYLLQEGLSVEKARHQIARYISKVSYAVIKNKIEYRAYQWRESKNKDS